MTNAHDRFDGSDLRDELETFGLTGTEIDTFLSVISSGEATTSEISDDADVTQRAVYNIAERLEDRGLVRVNDHASPTTIRALPPEEAIGNLTRRLESITPALEERFNETEPGSPEIRMVKSRSTALKRIRGMISEADHEVTVAIPNSVYSDVEPEVREALDRGALVFLLIGDLDQPERFVDRAASTAHLARYWNESLPFLCTADGRSAMIGDSRLLKGAHANHTATFVSEPHLGGSVLGLFLSAYWPTATELYVTDPSSLPETFDWFRTASLNATLHRRAGTELFAEVETGEGITVSGAVEEVRQALVEPSTNSYTLENKLLIETRDGEVSVGGPGAFIEDYEAERITLRPLEE